MYSKLNYLLVLGLVLGLTGSLVAQDPGTANLTHLWTFEDGSADDQIGEAHGELIGENVIVENGLLITLPNANGAADSWVELPGNLIDIGNYDEVSVVAWFTSGMENTQWNALWYFGDDGAGAGVGANGFCFQPCRGDNRARTWISCGNLTAPYNTEDGINDTTGLAATGQYTEYADGELHHVVCQIDDVSEIMMYHNGAFIGSTPLLYDVATGKDNAIFNISPNFGRFAHSCYYADMPWLGSINEIAIFNKALSSDEVTYLYENQNWSASLASVEKKEVDALPREFDLAQNYPNPFNPNTDISYTLNQSKHVRLLVFNGLGREVAILADGVQNQGKHHITFHAQELTSGVYYYQLQTETGSLTKKMILMK